MARGREKDRKGGMENKYKKEDRGTVSKEKVRKGEGRDGQRGLVQGKSERKRKKKTVVEESKENDRKLGEETTGEKGGETECKL